MRSPRVFLVSCLLAAGAPAVGLGKDAEGKPPVPKVSATPARQTAVSTSDRADGSARPGLQNTQAEQNFHVLSGGARRDGKGESGSAEALLAQGKAYEEARDGFSALEAYTRAIELKPDMVEALYRRGHLQHENLADLELAIKDFDAVLRLAPGHREAARELTKARLELAALDQPVPSEDGNPWGRRRRSIAYVARAQNRHQHSDVDGALADLEKAIILLPTDSTPYLVRGGYFRQKKDYDAATRDFTKALRLDAKLWVAYWERGRTFLVAGKLERARADAEKALQLEPNSGLLYELRSHIRYGAGEFAGARQDLETARAKGSAPDKMYYVYRAQIRSHSGDRAGALADYERVTQWDASASILLDRASVHLAAGNWQPALEDLAKAEKAEPFNLYVPLYRYVAKAKMGQAAEALQGLRSALERPGMEDPDEWLVKLARFILGEVSKEALLERVTAPDEMTTRGRQCEAWYFSGLGHQVAGHPEVAKACFQRCLDTKKFDFHEFQLAQAELEKAP